MWRLSNTSLKISHATLLLLRERMCVCKSAVSQQTANFWNPVAGNCEKLIIYGISEDCLKIKL